MVGCAGRVHPLTPVMPDDNLPPFSFPALALEAVRRIDLLFDSERAINGFDAAKQKVLWLA